MELISVIVPVYKVEKYLDRCVRSIVEQTYQNLEIILVDDGSPDRCPQMCDEWAQKDSRVRVIHQKNSGAGAARNAGIAVASGTVFAFADSDDYLSPYMYSHLISLLRKDIDIAECEIFTTESLDEDFPPETAPYQTIERTTEAALKEHILDRMFCQTPVNKLYRKHTLDGIPFPVGKLIDDEFWTYQVLGKAGKLVHSDLKLYAYVQQSDSAMHLSYSLRRLHAIDAKLERLSYVKERHPNLVAYAESNLWGTCLYQGQMTLRYLNAADRKTAFRKIKPIARSISFRSLRSAGTSLIYQAWFLLTRLSFRCVCRLRNILNIGI